jgi:hypothetical protein
MGTDGGLVHPGDHGGPGGGADGGGDKGVFETGAFTGELIDVWRFEGGFSVAGEVGGHVVDDEPHDVGSWVGGLAAGVARICLGASRKDCEGDDVQESADE